MSEGTKRGTIDDNYNVIIVIFKECKFFNVYKTLLFG